MNHQIHSSLAGLAVEISTLTPDPRNARQHDERNLKAVIDSFREHGQVKPIVVQRVSDKGLPMVIRAGNASTTAAKALGWTHIAAVVLDVSDKEARAYALRDNRTADLAEWDLPNLGAELRALKDDGFDVTTLGWEAFEYEPLMEAEWKPAPKNDEEFTHPGKKHNVSFTDAEFEQLKSLLGKKPSGADILKRLGLENTDTDN